MSGPEEARIAEMIGKVSLFSALKDKQLKSIAKSGKLVRFAEGQPIVKQGDSGVGFYLVLKGAVEVRKGKRVLSKMEEGGFFGEMSLLDHQPRSADVVATAPTECFVFSTWAFTGLLRADPDIGLKVMQELVRRLRSTTAALSE